jgi:hypothetical protein
MPLIRRFNPDDDERKLAGGAPAPMASAGGSGAPAPAAPQTPGGGRFVGLQDYLRANPNAGKETANNLVGGIESDFRKPTTSTLALMGENRNPLAGGGRLTAEPKAMYNTTARASDAAQVADVEQRAGAVATQGGREALLAKDNAKTGSYTQGMAALDAALSGQQGGDKMQATATRFKGLGDYLQGQHAQQDAPKKPRQVAYITEARTTGTAPGGYIPAGPQGDLAEGKYQNRDPNELSDDDLNAAGYMYEPAPGESYEHFDARVAARKRANAPQSNARQSDADRAAAAVARAAGGK